MIFGISVSGISSIPQSSSICSMNSRGFVSPSYLTDHLRTRSIALLLDINSEVARLGLVARDPVWSTVNVVRGVYLDSSTSRRSIVSLLGLIEHASAANAFRISSTVFTASRPNSAQAAMLFMSLDLFKAFKSISVSIMIKKLKVETKRNGEIRRTQSGSGQTGAGKKESSYSR
uniref:Uncharacterized protein n=1 Tax=Glossina austeni TaxID=7395 RepID=A0A1A9UDL9_GLOAU